MNVTVVGGEHNAIGEVIPIFKRNAKNPSAVVVTVPYLRDGDIRKISAGETINEAHGLFTAEVKRHYDGLLNLAKSNYPDLPIIGTAHLYINGCILSEPAESRIHGLGWNFGTNSFVSIFKRLRLCGYGTYTQTSNDCTS